MNKNEIQNLLNKRYQLFDIIHDCKSSINEISLNTCHTISLSDLKEKIDLEQYPELEYLFSQENINYLRPYHGQLMGLEDKNLGIVCRELVVAEISCLLGLDLTGRHGGGVCGLCDKRKIEIAKNQLEKVGVKTKPIIYFSDAIDIRLLYANNEKAFRSKKTDIKSEYKIFYNEDDNTFLKIENEASNSDGSRFSYVEDVYDLLFSYQNFLQNELVICDKVLDMECYREILNIRTLTLKEAIKETLSSVTYTFDGDTFYCDDSTKESPLSYTGDKNDIDTFVEFIANEMQNVTDENIAFVENFSRIIENSCVGCKIPTLEEVMFLIICIQNSDDDYYGYEYWY